MSNKPRGLYLTGSKNRASFKNPKGAGYYRDVFEEGILGPQRHSGRPHERLQPLKQARGRRIPPAQGRLREGLVAVVLSLQMLSRYDHRWNALKIQMNQKGRPAGPGHCCHYLCFSTITITPDAMTAVTHEVWCLACVRCWSKPFRYTSTFHPQSYSYPNAPTISFTKRQGPATACDYFHLHLASIPVPFKAGY